MYACANVARVSDTAILAQGYSLELLRYVVVHIGTSDLHNLLCVIENTLRIVHPLRNDGVHHFRHPKG